MVSLKEVASITSDRDVADRAIFLKVYFYETVLRRSFELSTIHDL